MMRFRSRLLVLLLLCAACRREHFESDAAAMTPAAMCEHAVHPVCELEDNVKITRGAQSRSFSR